MLVLSDFALSFSTRKFMRAIPRSTASVAEPTRQFCGRANARQILLATSIVLVAMASLLMHEPLLHAQVAAPRAVRPRRLNAKPLATGAQPGTANFSGNLTTITTSSNALALGRESDCTLTFETGNYSYTGSSITYGNTNQTSDYERVLHNEAQLTTTPDVFATPCIHQPIAGFGSRPAVFVGLTTSGVYVYAAIGAIAPSFINGVYLMTGATTLSLSSFQFSTANNLTAGDLDRDGNGDLVVLDNSLASSAHVTVFLGNADGTLKNGVQYAIAGNYSVAAAIADVNGDGIPDIVAVSGDQQISVLLGNGNGTFQEPALSFAAPALPGYSSAASTPIQDLILAKVNSDGNEDIICSNGLVLLGNGKGTFTPVAAPAFPYFQDVVYAQGPSVASGDLNKDGKVDLVVNNGISIETWMGNGNGTFTQGATYATIPTQGVVSVADLDGDGNPDIFVGLGNAGTYAGDLGSPNLAYALMGNGDGTFQGAAQVGFGTYTGNNLGDVTGSGTLDLITNTVDTPYGEPSTSVPTFTVQLGNGKGAFTPASTITAPASFSLGGSTITGANTLIAANYAVGDLNGDGKADLAFENADAIFASISNGDGTFQTPVATALPEIAPAGDFDDFVDLSSLQITNFAKNGPAGLVFVFNEQGGVGFNGPAFNPYNEGLVVLPGNSNGTFGAPVITTTFTGTTDPNSNFLPVIAAVADVDGDGNPDLVVINNTYLSGVGPESNVEIFLGNGDGTFKTPIPVNTPSNPTAVVLADFNHDGKIDIAVMCGAINANVDQIAIALGNKDGTFGTPTILTVSSDINGSATLAAADFNGDGNADLALFNYYGQSGIFYGNGNGTFSSVSASGYVLPQDLLNIAVSGPAVAVDLNKDGKPDILVGATVLLNQPGSALSTLTTPTVTVSPSPASITTAQSTMVTVSVSGGVGSATATGSVTLTSGTYTSAATTLTSGSASITVPGSSLGVAADTLTATYTPDTNSSTVYNSATGTSTVTVTTAPTPSFALSNGGSISVAAGATTGNTSTITVTPANSFTGAVNLTCALTTIPASAVSPATCAVTSSVNITGATAQSATLSVTTTSTTTAGAYAVTVTGVSGAITQTTIVGVTVTASAPPPTFALSNGGNISVAAGATTGNTSSITVTPANSFTGAVNLTCAVTTTPASAVSPATCAVSSVVNVTGATAVASTVSVTTTSTTTPGAYAVTVTGVSGAITQTTVVGVTVTAFVPPPRFALTNSGTVTISSPGTSTGNTATITVTPSGGFTGPVALTAAIATSPSGATDLPTLSFNGTTPVTVNGAAAATATLTVSTTAPVTGALVRPRFWTAAGGATLACLLLVGIPMRRRRWLNLIGMVALLVFLAAGVMSCGGGKSSNSGGNEGGTSVPGTTTGNYTITVTGTAGAETQTTTVNLTVN